MAARRTHITLFGKDYPIPPKGLYAGVPGQGPEGKQCRHCHWRDRHEYSHTVSKCWLMHSHWTNGAKTDIQATALACECFKENVEFSGGAPLHGAASAGTQG